MAVGRLYEMVRKGRANPFWAACGPRPRGDTQEVRKKTCLAMAASVTAGANLISDKTKTWPV